MHQVSANSLPNNSLSSTDQVELARTIHLPKTASELDLDLGVRGPSSAQVSEADRPIPERSCRRSQPRSSAARGHKPVVDQVRGRNSTARSNAGPYRRANREGREDSLNRKRTSGRRRPKPLTLDNSFRFWGGRRNDPARKQIELDTILVGRLPVRGKREKRY